MEELTKVDLGVTQEKDAEVLKEQILDAKVRIEGVLEGLTPEEAVVEVADWAQRKGLSYDQVVKGAESVQALKDGNPAGVLEASVIFNGLGTLPVEQVLKTVIGDYPLADLFPLETVKNGVKLMFYTDYGDGDNLKAYVVPDDYVAKMYQPGQAVAKYEAWKTYIDLHKGILIPNIALNDFTNSTAIFMAIYDNVMLQITRPIAKMLYAIRLAAVVNPFDIDSKADWSKITPDFTITATSGYDMISEIKALKASLSAVSRTNQPDRYKVTGMVNKLETAINFENYVMLTPKAFDSYVSVQLRSGAFNPEELNLPANRTLDYSKTFGEYGKQTNIKEDLTDMLLFLVPKNGMSIIQHYESQRSQPLLTMHSVTHVYHRVGIAIDKLKPVYIINVKLTQEAKPASKAKKA